MTVHDVIELFLRASAPGRAKGTIETYRLALARFTRYLESHKKLKSNDSANRLRVDDALDFALWCFEKQKLQRGTLHVYFAAVSTLYDFMIRERIISVDATDVQRMNEAWKNYRRGKESRLPKLPPPNSVSAILAEARAVESKKNTRLELARLRDIAIIETLRSSGVRVGELVLLRRKDLNPERHEAVVLGKGSKERVCFFDEKAWSALQAYLEKRDGQNKSGNLTVFARHDRRVSGKTLPMTTDAVRLIFNQFREKAGIEFNLTPHSLRHRFATDAWEKTSDIGIVQELLGHANADTTKIYAKVSPTRLRDAFHKAFGD